MADEDLNDVQHRLREYVFGELLRSKDSPAAAELRAAIREGLRDELSLIRKDFDAKVEELTEEVRKINRTKIDNGHLRAIAKRLGVVEQGSGDDRFESIKGPRRMSPLEAGLAVFVVVGGAFVAWMYLANGDLGGPARPPLGDNQAKIEGRGAPLVEDNSNADPQRQGWERLIGNEELRARLCDSPGPCDRALLNDTQEDLALQAAMNLVKERFACTGLRINEDGDIRGGGTTSIANVVRCVGVAAEDESRPICRDGACPAPPVPPGDLAFATKAEWREGTLNWALTLIGPE